MCARWFWGRSSWLEDFVSDDDAVYDKVIRLDVSDLAPMVTWGPILLWEWTLRLPFSRDSRHEWWTGLSLYGSQTWPKPADIELGAIFIGSVPMRVSVIWVGSQVCERQKIAPNLTAIVVPGLVRLASWKLGLGQDFYGCGLWMAWSRLLHVSRNEPRQGSRWGPLCVN